MKFLLPLLLLFLSAAVRAQIPPPDLLLDGAHCLVTASQNGLDPALPRSRALELASVTDNKTYSGADLLYLIDYAIPTHAHGTVFVFLVEGKDPHRVLHLQYRVGFRQSVDGFGRIQLDDPPFGGVGTEDAILASIRHIGFHTWTLPVTALARPSEVRCDMHPPIP